MSILFVLLMFLLIISVRYLIEPKAQPALEPEIVARPQPLRMKSEYGFEIPQGYCFHLGHTWVMKEGSDDARVGVDKFVTNLMGEIDHIDVRGANRWVRQGQKIITVSSEGTSIDLVSPVEQLAAARASLAGGQDLVVGQQREREIVVARQVAAEHQR